MARRQQCVFTDPRTGETYTWQINPPPDGISAAQKQRSIDRTSNTGNVGATKQQGDDGPFILHWEPLVYREAMETALAEWYVKCQKQTIYLTDWNGEQYEGQIITFSRQQIGAMMGPGDTTERGFYSKIVMEFEVYRFISGPLASAGMVP